MRRGAGPYGGQHSEIAVSERRNGKSFGSGGDYTAHIGPRIQKSSDGFTCPRKPTMAPDMIGTLHPAMVRNVRLAMSLNRQALRRGSSLLILFRPLAFSRGKAKHRGRPEVLPWPQDSRWKRGLVWRIWEALRLETDPVALAVHFAAWADQRSA